jgi:hypothetical protein
MASTQEVEEFEEVIEKIIFDEGELDELKIAIRNFSERKITPKQLKQNLLRSRGRMVKDISNFLIYCLNRARNSDQAPVDNNFTNLNQCDLANDQLRQEMAERTELLEVVAKRISILVSKVKKEPPTETESLGLEDSIKNEIKRVFLAIKIDEWFDMCGYNDYKFYVKLYNKLQALYRQKFGDDGKKSKNTKNAKVEHEIMAEKIAKLKFPEEVTTELIMYIIIRNNAEHDNYDLTPSDMEIAHNAFVWLFIYLITSNLDAQLLAGNEKSFYRNLHQYFSSRLERNPKFLEKVERSLGSLFNNYK